MTNLMTMMRLRHHTAALTRQGEAEPGPATASTASAGNTPTASALAPTNPFAAPAPAQPSLLVKTFLQLYLFHIVRRGNSVCFQYDQTRSAVLLQFISVSASPQREMNWSYPRVTPLPYFIPISLPALLTDSEPQCSTRSKEARRASCPLSRYVFFFSYPSAFSVTV